MGTFHSDKGELHGITVIVDTNGPKVFVGRCHEEQEEGILLLDAGEHSDGEDGKSKQEYIEAAAKFGVWAKHKHITVPRTDIFSIRRLGEVSAELKK